MPKTDPTPEPTRTPQADLAPFYAVAGLADVISETLRATLAERQARAAQRFNDEIKVNADELREFLADLPNQVRALPETTRSRLTDLQRQAEELLAQANSTYSTLAGRGKRVVDDRVGAVRGTTARTRTAAQEAAEDVAEEVADAAEEAVTTTRRNVTGRTTRKSAPRTRAAASSEEAADVEVSPAEATEQARLVAAKQPTKTTPPKKTPTKKAAVKKTTAKKAPSAKAATTAPAAAAQEHPVVEAAPDAAPDAGPATGPGTES